jgi:hypothetical protein
MKRIFLLLAVTIATASLNGQSQHGSADSRRKQKPFIVVEATIPEMQAAMKAGRV